MKIVSIDRELNTDQNYIYYYNTLFPNSIVQQIIQMKTRLDMVKENKNGEQQCLN